MNKKSASICHVSEYILHSSQEKNFFMTLPSFLFTCSASSPQQGMRVVVTVVLFLYFMDTKVKKSLLAFQSEINFQFHYHWATATCYILLLYLETIGFSTVKSRFNEFRFKVMSRFKVQNEVTKMEFNTKKSRFSVKSRFKEPNCADRGHSLNRDFTVVLV